MSPNRFEVLAWERTPLGLLCLRRRELLSDPGAVVTEVTLDHELLMSSYNTDSERALASRALALHGGSGLDVLVGGLGLGFTAKEALASDRVARVEVVELLPQVIGWLERGLLPDAAALRAEPRLSLARGDVYARLAAAPERTHDIILVDVDHSPEDRLGGSGGGFYTASGLEAVRRHLRPAGVLGVWSYEESPAFASALRGAFAQVRIEPVVFENRLIDRTRTDWIYLARI